MLSVVNFWLQKDIQNNKVLEIPFSVSLPAPYPILHATNINPEDINLLAESAIIVDDSSKVVLFSKNPTLHFSMASTTKIMTALVALDYYNLDDLITIKTDNVSGTVVGFKIGETYEFKDVLYAMMLPSGNDAALAIAQNYPGGEKAFILQMNKKAKELHLESTHYGDSSGLLDNDDYSTAVDLARLASVAIQNPVFSSVVSTKQKTITSLDNSHTFTFSNINKLLGFDGVNGIKTGFTSEAKGVLVTSRKDGDHTLIFVVMKSDDRFADTINLLSLVSGNITYQSISE